MNIVDNIVKKDIGVPLFYELKMFFMELLVTLERDGRFNEMYSKEKQLIRSYIEITRELKFDMECETIRRRKIKSKMMEGFHIYGIARSLYYCIVRQCIFLTNQEKMFFSRLIQIIHRRLQRYENMNISDSDTSESKSSV